MIIEWLIAVAADVAIWMATLFPEWELPAWLLDPQGPMRIMLEGYNGLGVWFDWGVLGTCVVATVTAFVAGGGTKLLRSVATHLPFVGGSGN